MFPYFDKIQEPGYDIEFAYATFAMLEVFSEKTNCAIALLKNRADDSYCLKYYIREWRGTPAREDRILLHNTKKAFLLAERANRIYPCNVQRIDGFDGYDCYFYQRRRVVYSWWVACPDEWVDMQNVVKELADEIPYPSPLHQLELVTVSQEMEFESEE